MARKDAAPMDMPAAGMAAATALASRLGVTVAPAVAAATRRPHATSTASADDLKLPLIPTPFAPTQIPRRQRSPTTRRGVLAGRSGSGRDRPGWAPFVVRL